MYRAFIFSLFICIALNSPVSAQFRVDTVKASEVVDTGGFQMSRSPTLALGLSALLPGAGQVYLNQWWKVPIIYGLIGGFLAGAYIQNSRYLTNTDLANASLAKHTFADSIQAQVYAGAREFYHDDRDKWYIYATIAYITNILDAYIAANLFDFDVSDPQPHPMLGYEPRSREFKMSLRLSF